MILIDYSNFLLPFRCYWTIISRTRNFQFIYIIHFQLLELDFCPFFLEDTILNGGSAAKQAIFNYNLGLGPSQLGMGYQLATEKKPQISFQGLKCVDVSIWKHPTVCTLQDISSKTIINVWYKVHVEPSGTTRCCLWNQARIIEAWNKLVKLWAMVDFFKVRSFYELYVSCSLWIHW